MCSRGLVLSAFSPGVQQLEDFQGQRSHHTVSRRTVGKTKVETLSRLRGKTAPLPKGLASLVPEYLLDQLLRKTALVHHFERKQESPSPGPQPTVPEGLGTGRADTPKPGPSARPRHPNPLGRVRGHGAVGASQTAARPCLARILQRACPGPACS